MRTPSVVARVENMDKIDLVVSLGVDGRYAWETKNELLSYVIAGLHDGRINRKTPLRQVIEQFKKTNVGQLRLPLGGRV